MSSYVQTNKFESCSTTVVEFGDVPLTLAHSPTDAHAFYKNPNPRFSCAGDSWLGDRVMLYLDLILLIFDCSIFCFHCFAFDFTVVLVLF